MRIKSLMKNKKAFSAIIAALILMLIAVAAGVVVYAYVMGWIGGVQTNPPGSGIITIESYTSDTLYIRNHGTNTLTIDTVYIDNTPIFITDSATIDNTPDPVALSSGLNTIVFDADTFTAGNLVKIVCDDGTTVSQTLV
ncbi:MAG: hypothetical protein PHC63_06070 [Candidatus Bathyarchaeota archaeon]|nr:hypothetical protein [Candidatus Bathyarchaeota archaeon]